MAFSVQYDFRVLDRFSGPLQKAKRHLNALGRELEKFEKISRKSSSIINEASWSFEKLGVDSRIAAQNIARLNLTSNRSAKGLTNFANETHRTAERLKLANASTKQFEQSLKKTSISIKSVSERAEVLGHKLANFRTAAGTAGAVMALRDIVGVAQSFEFAMNKVEAVTGSNAEQMQAMREQAKMLGATTQFSAVQAGEAMTFLGMAGLKANDILSVMPGMLDLAAAGDLQLADAADIATNVLSMFGMELSQIGHLSDVLAAAAANSNTNVYELAEALKNAGTTAHLAGLSVEQTTASLMLMAKMGIKGGEAGTQLMNALRAITAMTPKAAKSLKNLGIDPKKLLDSEGKIRDFNEIVKLLASKGATLKEMFSIFDIRGAKAMSILKESGDKQLSEFTKMLDEVDGTGKQMAKTLMKGLPGAIKLFDSALEGVKLTMSDAIKGPLTGFLNITASIMGFIQQKAPWILKLATYFLTLIAVLGTLTIVVGVALSLFSALALLASMITAPMLAIGGAVAAVAGAFAYWSDSGHPVIAMIKEIGSIVWDAFAAVGELFGAFDAGTKVTDVLAWILNKLGSAIKLILVPIKAMALIFRGLVETITALLSLDFGKLGSIFGKLAGGFGGLAGDAFSAVKDFVGIGASSGSTAKEASQQKSAVSASNNQVQANINLRAGKGTNIAVAEPDLNTGGNVALAY